MSLIKIWKNKGKILEGIKNHTFKQEHIEEIHDERMKICKECTYYDKKGSECYVPGTKPCCGECCCSLALKLRSLSSECDLAKWSAILNEEEEDKLNESL